MVGLYGIDVKLAGMLAASFSLSASVFRAYGGVLSDKYGARRLMYATFGVSLVLLFILSYPATDYTIHGIDGPVHISTSLSLVLVVLAVLVLGFFISTGQAAVFKQLSVYYHES